MWVELQTERSLPLRPRQTRRLACHAGVVWLTREGDIRDVFLSAGDQAEIGPGLTVVTALEPSMLYLFPARRWWSVAGALFSALRRRRALPAVHGL